MCENLSVFVSVDAVMKIIAAFLDLDDVYMLCVVKSCGAYRTNIEKCFVAFCAVFTIWWIAYIY